jgi:hypothetical protein
MDLPKFEVDLSFCNPNNRCTERNFELGAEQVLEI